MKKVLPVILLLVLCNSLRAQITTPVINANFGVDADLRSNYFNNFLQNGNDDWFHYPGSIGMGKMVIDTTGAAAMVARYTVDPEFRKIPFYRTMHYPSYSIINNRLLIDAVFTRDYHGSDSTVFASGSNKNGMSPEAWTTPIAQGIPDKNDILDMMVHVRRAGPDPSYNLWLMGGISIENTVGNRYFDFEMYQTDIYYDRATRRFYGYGPDAGHTSWKFDAGGAITQPGDIIFTAEYSSNSLTKIEARIWVHRDALLITPQDFQWTGSFNGASNGATYGYAGILPKTTGDFYTGMASGKNVWAGPFALIRENNSMVTDYIAGQYMEFSVNLTKLGLDPVTLLGGDDCGMPFRRVLVKSRSSTSFTAELKDFVGPFDFFLAPRVAIQADVPMYCGTIGVSEIFVTNPVSTSVYEWSTEDGHIVGSTTGTSIQVDAPGTYTVTHRLQAGCSVYATDTTMIIFEPFCTILTGNNLQFEGSLRDNRYHLQWTVQHDNEFSAYEIERSTNGVQFTSIGYLASNNSGLTNVVYKAVDDLSAIEGNMVYYRLKIKSADGKYYYSKVVKQTLVNSNTQIRILTNPVKDNLQLVLSLSKSNTAYLSLYDVTGKLLQSEQYASMPAGRTTINLSGMDKYPPGMYTVKMQVGENIFNEKVMISH